MACYPLQRRGQMRGKAKGLEMEIVDGGFAASTAVIELESVRICM